MILQYKKLLNKFLLGEGHLFNVLQKRLKKEIQRYQKIFQGRIWLKVKEKFADAIEEIIEVRTLYQYVARHVAVLGLGTV